MNKFSLLRYCCQDVHLLNVFTFSNLQGFEVPQWKHINRAPLGAPQTAINCAILKVSCKQKTP